MYVETDPPEDGPVAAVETPLCPRCATPYLEGTDLCASCGAPLGVAAWVGTAQGVQAEGWFAGEAARRERPTRLLLVSAWVVLLPTALFGLLLPFVVEAPWTAWVFAAPYGLLVSYVLVRLTRNYLRGRSETRREEGSPGTSDAAG